MMDKNNCKLSLGQKVRYSGKRTRNLRENSEGVIVKGRFNSRRTPLVRFDDISVYIPRTKLVLITDTPNKKEMNTEEVLTPKKIKARERLDEWKKEQKGKEQKAPSKYELILENRKMVSDNRSKRRNKREEMRLAMKEDIYTTENDKKANKIGSKHRQIDDEIHKLKEELWENPEKQVELKDKIGDLNMKQKDLMKYNERLKFMYSNGYYSLRAHSPTTYFDLCLGKRVHFSSKPRVMDVEESEETNYSDYN